MNRLIVYSVLLAGTFSCCNNKKGDPDIEYSSAVPTSFIFENKRYISSNVDLNYCEKVKIGWLVNYEDLAKWKTLDNNDNIYYAISYENAIYRNVQDPILKNRFELCLVKGHDEYLAVLDYNYPYYFLTEICTNKLWIKNY